MKTARIAVLGIAVASAGGAVLVANTLTAPAPQEAAPPPAMVEMTQVLVASGEVPVGKALGAGDLRWQDWPKSAVSSVYITKTADPNAATDWVGAVARAPFVDGEPLRPQKLIKANGSGFLSAILPAGMRAIATKIAVDTAAGGFILPNDHVDVILTRRDSTGSGGDSWATETVLRNVRVLAIDQTIEDKDGQKVITGSTATLELASQQAEVLALAKELGQISLALRSLADSGPLAASGPDSTQADTGANRGLTVVRYGVPTTIVNR